jgi:hypothetical protein
VERGHLTEHPIAAARDVVAVFDQDSAALITGRSSAEEAVTFAATLDVRDTAIHKTPSTNPQSPSEKRTEHDE